MCPHAKSYLRNRASATTRILLAKKVQRSLSISKEEVNMYAKQLFFQVRVFESTLATTTVITHARDEKSKPL